MSHPHDDLAGIFTGIPRSSCRRPVLRDGVVARDDLIKQLVDIPRDHVVLFEAPAAFGKTTTLALWDAADDRTFVWVHLGRADNDPQTLLRHIATAAAPVDTLPAEVARTLTGAGSSPLLHLAPSVVGLLEDLEPTVVVLDDLHEVTAGQSLRCIEALLAAPIHNVQFVLSTRSRPALQLGRTMMTSGLTTIGAAALAMDGDTAGELFRRSGLDVAPEVADELVERTEGWPGGLHLVTLKLTQQRGAPDECPSSGDDRLLMDYLVQEVIETQPSHLIDFLEQSAVLEEMTPSLVDELLDRSDSAVLFTSIERSGNLFLVPLDHALERYRYHQLLADTLRDRLRRRDRDLYRHLHARASTLLQRQGDIGAAVHHSIEAADEARAADLILRQAIPLMNSGGLGRLVGWLGALGPEVRERNVAAAIAWCWYALASGDVALFKTAYAAAEALADDRPLADGSPSAEATLATLRALTAWTGCAGVIDDTEIVRNAADATKNPLWGMATVLQGTAHAMLGELTSARDRYLEVLTAAQNAPATEVSVRTHLGILAFYEDDVTEADRWSSQAARLMEHHNLDGVLPTVQVHPLRAVVATRLGRHEDARTSMQSGQMLVSRLGYLSPRTALLGNYLLAESALALGDPIQAREFVREAERARRRDPSAIYIVERLGQLATRLATTAAQQPTLVEPLTAAQLRVLAYLPTHLMLQEIADELIISRNTIKSHCRTIYMKLGVTSRGEAVAEARRLGILTSS